MSARGVLLETPGAWSEPLLWPLREGEQKLLTLGSNADWSIADGGLLPVHATLYFDGANLNVAAAPGARLNGEPLVQEWNPVALPAQLSLGSTQITIAPSEPEGRFETAPTEIQSLNDKTTVMQFPDLEEFRREARRNGWGRRDEPESVNPSEGDRVTPTGAFQAPVHDPDQTLFALPALSAPAPAPAPAPPPKTRVSEPLTSPPVSPSIGQSFRSASWPKRITVLLLPVVIGLYGLKAVRSPKAVKHTAPAPSASASTRAIVSAAPTPAVTPSTPSAASPSSNRAPGVTTQQRALDAFASGSFRDAAVLYQRLASENPQQPVFAAAARIAREKANGADHD